MNCKQGDLAIKVHAVDGAFIGAGAIVRVVYFAGIQAASLASGGQAPIGARWIVEYKGSTRNPESGRLWSCLDSDLRPIRDNDGEDETLQWAPVPTKETA